MFNMSGSEIVVILLLALIVLGPEKLPDAMRRAGKTWAELKKLSGGFQDEVRKGFDEPVREMRQTAAAVKKATRLPVDTTAATRDPKNDKPRHNPAIDAAPGPPAGSSVAEPLEDASPDGAEVAAEHPAEVADDPAEVAEHPAEVADDPAEVAEHPAEVATDLDAVRHESSMEADRTV